MPGTALIVRVPGDERIYLPLRAELGSYRFRVLELPDRPGRRAETLSELARARDAQAALRARPDSMAVELWVQGSAGASEGTQELVGAGPGRSPDLLALRVTEAMRARGLVLPPPSAATTTRPALEQAAAPAVTPAAPPANAAPPGAGSRPSAAPGPTPQQPAAAEPTTAALQPTAAAPPAPKPPDKAAEEPTPARALKPQATAAAAPAKPARDEPASQSPPTIAQSSRGPALPLRKPLLFVEAAPLGIISPRKDSLGPAVDALVQLRLQPYRSSSISLFGFIPLWQATLDREQGSAQVRAWAIGGFADLNVPWHPIELSAGLGAAGLLISVEGEARAPYQKNDRPERLAVFLGRVGMNVSLTRDLRLTARVMAGIVVPELRIEFVKERVAGWGRPLVLGSLGLELALPWDR